MHNTTMKSSELTKETQGRIILQNHFKLEEGLIHYYYGDGKGKTTTLIGSIIRGLGHGLKPVLIQFLKLHDEKDDGKGYFMGEVNFLKNFIPVKQFGSGSFIKVGEKENSSNKRIIRDGLEFMKKTIEEGKYDIVALDEVINLISFQFISVEDLIEILENKPEHVEIICTGAMYYKQLKAISDYVIQFNCLTHPYYEGIQARKGIEF